MRTTLYFRKLQRLLREPGIPNQTEIASAVGTDQPFVSRAMQGKLIRITPRVVALRRYAFMRVRDYSPPDAATAPVTEAASAVRQSALEACEDYLTAGFDPAMLRDQVGLLRRAQASAGRARGATHSAA